MDDPDAAEFTAYEQNMQLVTIDQGAVLQTSQAGQMVVLPATSTGLALTCGSDLSLVHVATPSFRFKQLDTDTDLNTAPSALQRQAHLESLMKTSRKQQQQMSLRLHGGHVELAGCGDEYGYEDFEALPPSFGTSSRSHASSSSSSTPTHDDMVHFLGPAENIKTLFKLPYSNSRVSLAIHRVGNTLIVDGEVDETDLPRGFDACNEVLQPDQPSQRTYLPSPPSHLYENFIYQSTQLITPPPSSSSSPPPLSSPVQHSQRPPHPPNPSSKRRKARAQLQKQADRQPDVVPATFGRTFSWTFHDMKMLLGSDVQLFSNKDHPAVSLKLHDVNDELSLCTALDYYLDNVIANIPELAICMHSHGYVRGYQLLQTRDIPYLNGAASRPLFDVQDVDMNATMLLRFLQQNCTASNGTYWLFREEGSRSLRLYDVRMLSQGKQRKWKYMMAMLCYRFASRAGRLVVAATASPTLQHRLRLRQRELLATCLELLDEIRTQPPQTSSCHHHPQHPSMSPKDSISAMVEEAMADTYLHGMLLATPHDAIEATASALPHLVRSIRVLEGCALHHTRQQQADPLSQDNDDDDNDGDDDDDNGDDVAEFMQEEVLRLKLKHCSACLHLATLYLDTNMHAKMLTSLADACMFMPVDAVPAHPRHVLLSVITSLDFFSTLATELDFGGAAASSTRSYKSSNGSSKQCQSMSHARACVLEVIGDAANVLDTNDTPTAAALFHAFAVVSGGLLPSHCYDHQASVASVWVKQHSAAASSMVSTDTAESLRYMAFFAYLNALEPQVPADSFFVLMKKLGNAANELGKFYLGRSDFTAAYLWFEGGSILFDTIEDGVNTALIYANLAHLHKVLAETEASTAAESHYAHAVQLCFKAQAKLKSAKAGPPLHAKVNGELALTYLVWAVHLAKTQDNHLGVLEKFNKALNMYVELRDRRQVAATHYQMASYYSQQQVKTKQRMEAARRHYEKALEYFGGVEVGTTFVMIHKQLAELYASSTKMEDVEHALLVVLNTFDAFKRVATLPRHEQADLESMAPTLVLRLQEYLLQLIRLGSASTKPAMQATITRFKAMYRLTIDQNTRPFAQLLLALRNMYE